MINKQEIKIVFLKKCFFFKKKDKIRRKKIIIKIMTSKTLLKN